MGCAADEQVRAGDGLRAPPDARRNREPSDGLDPPQPRAHDGTRAHGLSQVAEAAHQPSGAHHLQLPRGTVTGTLSTADMPILSIGLPNIYIITYITRICMMM